MNDYPLTRISNTLESITGYTPKRNGEGYIARCPAHDDHNPSLSITETDDRTVLLHCFAGCTVDSIVESLGLCLGDLYQGNARLSTKPNVKHAKSRVSLTSKRRKRVYSTAEGAIASYEKRYGMKYSQKWAYEDGHYEIVRYTVRFDLPNDRKVTPPVSLNKDRTGWITGEMAEPTVLYALPEIGESELVFVCEGEKATEAIRGLGFCATTSPGGCKAVYKADWTPLAGKQCVILPDNDKPGQQYANDVISILMTLFPMPAIKRIELPGLGHGEDAYDYIERLRKAG